MVLAYHSIFSAYGSWLPNDPRGSWSDYVRSYELYRFGGATKTIERRSHANDDHDNQARNDAKEALRFPPVVFDGVQALAIAQGFSTAVKRTGAVVYACAIMPDHVHMVIARHGYEVEKLVGFLKGDATRRLMERGLHPLVRFARPGKTPPSPWVRFGWNVFLSTPDQIQRAVDYANANLPRDGYKAQNWSIVTPYRP